MPELPEVETIKRGLENKVIGKKITNVEVMQKKSIRNPRAEFVKKLKSKSIEKIERKGKFLAIKLKSKDLLRGNLNISPKRRRHWPMSPSKTLCVCATRRDLYLIIHLGMTGQLVYIKDKRATDKHSRVLISFNDGARIYFNDIRRFGYLKLADAEEKEEIFSALGVDSISKDFTFKKLISILKNRRASLKSILLNQKLVAGIGNIYTDEICFVAGLKPNRKVNTLGSAEIKKLYNSIKRVLKLAIKHHGTSFRDYVDSEGKRGNFASFLKVYQRENQICLKCRKGVIKKIKIAGRSTRYCENCQR